MEGAGIQQRIGKRSGGMLQAWVQARLRKGNEAGAAAGGEILERLQETSRALSCLRSCFDLETDPDLMDSYILELGALEKRYSYLLRRAREENIRVG